MKEKWEILKMKLYRIWYKAKIGILWKYIIAKNPKDAQLDFMAECPTREIVGCEDMRSNKKCRLMKNI